MDYQPYLKKSKQVVWISADDDDRILSYSKGFLSLFQLRRLPEYATVNHFLRNWSRLDCASNESVNFNLEDTLYYADICLTYSEGESGYELIGDLPASFDSGIVSRMSEMNQEFLILTREINKNNSELEHVIQQLKDTQVRLIQEERMAGLGRIASGIAHEINNPLAIVMSNMTFVGSSMKELGDMVDALKEHLTPSLKEDLEFIREDSEALLKEIESGLTRIKEIVKAFRVYSDIDTFEKISQYPIDEGIRTVIEVVGSQLDEENISISTDLRADTLIAVEAGEFNQVLTHLIQNAVYSYKDLLQENNEIKIATRTLDKTVHITIEDNGCGIDERAIDYAFDPFYSTRDVGEGKGLGLSICYDIIVRKYKGSITIKSDLNKGTIVSIVMAIE